MAQLVESPTNPRKRYDEANLQELAESIRSQGVLQPLLVRELNPKRFEIITGPRSSQNNALIRRRTSSSRASRKSVNRWNFLSADPQE
jgi:ParB/RepB/Spo0J family partition protein